MSHQGPTGQQQTERTRNFLTIPHDKKVFVINAPSDLAERFDHQSIMFTECSNMQLEAVVTSCCCAILLYPRYGSFATELLAKRAKTLTGIKEVVICRDVEDLEQHLECTFFVPSEPEPLLSEAEPPLATTKDTETDTGVEDLALYDGDEASEDADDDVGLLDITGFAELSSMINEEPDMLPPKEVPAFTAVAAERTNPTHQSQNNFLFRESHRKSNKSARTPRQPRTREERVEELRRRAARIEIVEPTDRRDVIRLLSLALSLEKYPDLLI